MDPWIWAVLLLVLGATLALMEVFFPSAGLLGFLSASALVAAVVMGFYQQPWVGWSILGVEALGIPVLIALAFRYWPKTAIGRRFLLAAPKSDEVLPEDPKKERLKQLIGRTGRAKSKLLLSGVVTIDGQTVDATSESMPIDVGQPVRVVALQGHAVIVRPIAEEDVAKLNNPLQQTYDDPFDAPPLDRP
jgi:membrane-bound ClpP family serine protease